MQPVAAFAAILGAVAVGAMSPGPSFVVVARTAVAASRGDGMAAALGMGIGGLTFGVLALLGLQAVLAKTWWLYAALKLLGGGYLLYLGFRLWRGAAEPIVLGHGPLAAGGFGRSLLVGATTQLSNPKTAIAYASIFAALLPASPPAWLYVALPPLIFLVETGWYSVVALAFSAGRPRAAYLASKSWIDRIAGTVLAALGAKLIFETSRTA